MSPSSVKTDMTTGVKYVGIKRSNALGIYLVGIVSVAGYLVFSLRARGGSHTLLRLSPTHQVTVTRLTYTSQVRALEQRLAFYENNDDRSKLIIVLRRPYASSLTILPYS